MKMPSRTNFLSVLLLFGNSGFLMAQSATLTKVAAAPGVVKSLNLTTTQPGRITAYEETPITSKLSGYVESVAVDIGSMVTKGQVLIKLAVPEMKDELAQREALLAQAHAELKQANSSMLAAEAGITAAEAGIQEAMAGRGRATATLEQIKSESGRIQQLAKTGSVTSKLADESTSQLKASEASITEVEAKIKSAKAAKAQCQAIIGKVQADILTAEARVRVAEANVAHSQTMLGYLEIKAPFEGVITTRNVDTGHFVQAAGAAGVPLLTVARTDLMRVRVDVPEMEASYIDADEKSGDEATISIQSLNRPPVKAKCLRCAWSLDPNNRSMRTEMDLPNPDKMLRPGMYASITILLDKRTDVLVLPITAINKKDGAPYCCVVNDGKISHRPIELGLKVGPEVEIKSGLNASDVVVTIRGESLVDGQMVSVIAAKQ
jgi:HlyD family secretion protein